MAHSFPQRKNVISRFESLPKIIRHDSLSPSAAAPKINFRTSIYFLNDCELSARQGHWRTYCRLERHAVAIINKRLAAPERVPRFRLQSG